MIYLWLKAFHIIFMVTWFAGLFYLPRLFVYHAMPENKPSFELFKVMEKRLFGIMTIGAMLTILLGLAIIMINPSAYLKSGWLHFKFLMIFALIAYHAWCFFIMKTFREGNNTRTHKWYRWFNEVPAIALVAIVLIVVLKPF